MKEKDMVTEFCNRLYSNNICFVKEHRIRGARFDVVVYKQAKPHIILEFKQTMRPNFLLTVQGQKYRRNYCHFILVDGPDRVNWAYNLTVDLLNRPTKQQFHSVTKMNTIYQISDVLVPNTDYQ